MTGSDFLRACRIEPDPQVARLFDPPPFFADTPREAAKPKRSELAGDLASHKAALADALRRESDALEFYARASQRAYTLRIWLIAAIVILPWVGFAAGWWAR